MDYLKSAFNYTGQKYPILDQIFQLFPVEVDLFVDVFCGGGSVFINSKYQNIIANDIISPLISFYVAIQEAKTFGELKACIQPYILDKYDKESFFDSRKLFNENGAKDPYHFFALIVSCTNNMVRFNKKFLFNSTHGKRTYNPKTEEKLIAYHQKLKYMNVKFTCNNYIDCIQSTLENSKKNTFFYLDPPYYISEAGYNAYWSKDLEAKLYDSLNNIDSSNKKFALSTVITHKGVDNPHLNQLKKYNIHHIEHNYNKVAKRTVLHQTKEVLITNY